MKRQCTNCKIFKKIEDFPKTNDGKYICKKCKVLKQKIYRKNLKEKHPEKYKERNRRYEHTPKAIYRNIKFQSVRRNKPFNIDKEVFVQWYESTPKKCSYCGVRESDWTKVGKTFCKGQKRLSIDRIDNSIGYQIDNITFACARCNVIKNDILTFKEMQEIGQKYIKPKILKELSTKRL